MKQFISGKEITKKEAYKGLGDPKKWVKEKKKILKEFLKKPLTSDKSLIYCINSWIWVSVPSKLNGTFSIISLTNGEYND